MLRPPASRAGAVSSEGGNWVKKAMKMWQIPHTFLIRPIPGDAEREVGGLVLDPAAAIFVADLVPQSIKNDDPTPTQKSSELRSR